MIFQLEVELASTRWVHIQWVNGIYQAAVGLLTVYQQLTDLSSSVRHVDGKV